MAKSVPQKNDFKLIGKLSRTNRYLFFAIILFSAIPVISSYLVKPEFKEIIRDTALLFNLIALVVYHIILFIIEFSLVPVAEKKRRSDMFDNAFGTKLNFKESEGYFTNDSTPKGTKKLAVNLFQNCFWSSSISKKMIGPVILKTVVVSVVILVLAFWGFKNVILVIPVLQIFFSVFVLKGMIKLILFSRECDRILEELKELFDNQDNYPHAKFLGRVIKAYNDYETNIARSMVQLNSKVFKRMNDTLETEWSEIKKKYKIE